MHTFFHEVPTGASQDTNLKTLDLWREAWSEAGWEPKILTLQDAKRHPRFAHYEKKLYEQVRILHNPVEYNRMCFLRWLAMAAAGGGFMSDYDVLPLGL